jgi:hypothetical protein
MSASSDAFFAPEEIWKQFLAHQRWVDEARARDLLEELIGEINGFSPERRDSSTGYCIST